MMTTSVFEEEPFASNNHNWALFTGLRAILKWFVVAHESKHTREQVALSLTWINFYPSMDK